MLCWFHLRGTVILTSLAWPTLPGLLQRFKALEENTLLQKIIWLMNLILTRVLCDLKEVEFKFLSVSKLRINYFDYCLLYLYLSNVQIYLGLQSFK